MAWWTVHEFVTPWLAGAGSFPMVGTPAWCALDGTDPAKWAAALDAAQHWALRLEYFQEELGEVSKAVAGAADWQQVAAEVQQRAGFYAAKPWLQRRTS
ncbi:hypothetical protein CG716_04875 [Mycolicibacterium sphagni]|uniref:DUF2742 domain-containing protein n=1 Tax=Mycolicibacterium sphagni TaxID=1786 RepID=A0A255E1E5_9MYCO|nr:hypothetical protein CG716_04875 [Mycolicibacterium sphagni]